jgi:hypothetical protein
MKIVVFGPFERTGDLRDEGAGVHDANIHVAGPGCATNTSMAV